MSWEVCKEIGKAERRLKTVSRAEKKQLKQEIAAMKEQRRVFYAKLRTENNISERKFRQEFMLPMDGIQADYTDTANEQTDTTNEQEGLDNAKQDGQQ